MSGAGGSLMLAGAVAVLVGMLLRRWAAPYDLKDAAMASAWAVLRGKRTANNPTAIETKLQSIAAQPTWTGKATSTAGAAVGHFLSGVVRLVGLVLLLAGLAALAGGGFLLWR